MAMDTIAVSTRLAAALLLRQGEISASEIRALPFVENKEAVRAVMERLVRAYPLEAGNGRAGARHSQIETLRLRLPEKPGRAESRSRVAHARGPAAA